MFASQDHRREARAILGTAAPVAAMALVNNAMSVTDTLMAAALGAEALAAAALGNDFYSLVFYLAIGILGGLTPLYGAAHSAADEEALRRLRKAGWAGMTTGCSGGAYGIFSGASGLCA
jgi:multidrug resistance protein, MATE family